MAAGRSDSKQRWCCGISRVPLPGQPRARPCDVEPYRATVASIHRQSWTAPIVTSRRRLVYSSFGRVGLSGHNEPPVRQGSAPVRRRFCFVSRTFEDSTKRGETRVSDDHDVVPVFPFCADQHAAHIAYPEEAVVFASCDVVEGRRIALKIGFSTRAGRKL